MISVTKKDPRESLENLLRRFNRKVQQAGIVANAKIGQHFEKPLSKRDRRKQAIVRRARKAVKMRKIKFGQK